MGMTDECMVSLVLADSAIMMLASTKGLIKLEGAKFVRRLHRKTEISKPVRLNLGLFTSSIRI